MKVTKELRPLVGRALDQGWTMTQTRHGHPKLRSPDGRYSIPMSETTLGHGTVRWIEVQLRRHGVV